MSKKYCIFITTLFCAFIGLFLVANAASPDREFSEMENRNLEQMPTISAKSLLSGEFMKDFETYTTDQFVGRDAWIGLKSSMERALGKKENNNVYFCDEDTLITRFDQPDATKVSENLNYVNNFVENVDIPVTFSLIPTQACIWADRLPAGAPNASQTDLLEQAKAAVPGATWADLYSSLWEHKDEDIFYRTDHHWTSLGAYYGYAAVMETLGRGEDTLPMSAFTLETASTDFNGTLYSQSGIHWLTPDTIEFWVQDDGLSITSWRTGEPQSGTLYDRSYLEKKDKYSSFLGGNQPLCVIRNEAAAGKGKLLLIRDSYSDSLAPFLAQSFEEVHLIDTRYYRMSPAQYAAENGIDEICVLFSIPNFITEKSLVFIGQ